MSVEEIEREANVRWLSAHGVTDFKTRTKEKRNSAKKALRRLSAFIESMNDLSMIDDLWPDGTHTRLSPQSKDEWRRIYCKINAIENHIKRYAT